MLVAVFVGFEDWEDLSCFPCVRNGVLVDDAIVESGDTGYGVERKVF